MRLCTAISIFFLVIILGEVWCSTPKKTAKGGKKSPRVREKMFGTCKGRSSLYCLHGACQQLRMKKTKRLRCRCDEGYAGERCDRRLLYSRSDWPRSLLEPRPHWLLG